MAEGIVYLDVDDEITSAASRIRSSAGTKIALVVPYGSRIATSRINFRLLSREALVSNRRLSVIAGDAASRALAASAGLPVFATVTEYESALAGPKPAESDGAGPGEREPSVVAVPEAASPPEGATALELASAPRPRRDRKAPGRKAAAAAAALADEAVAVPPRPRPSLDDDVVPRPEPARPEPGLPIIGGRRASPPAAAVAAIAAIALALVVVGAAAYLLLPSATIAITPLHETIGPIPLTISADPTATSVDAQNSVIPALRIEIPVEASQTFTTTGKHVEQAAAKGSVTFTNYDTGGSNSVPAGSVVSTQSGIRFKTLATVSLPPADFFPVFVPSRRSVAIAAATQGPGGNVAANTIRVVPQGENPELLHVNNPDPTSGGVRTETPQVSKAEVERAVAALRKALQATFDQNLAAGAGAPPGTDLFPATATLGAPKFGVDPAKLIGQAVDTFDLTVSATGSVIAVDPSPVRSIAEGRVRELVGAGHELVDGSVHVDVGNGSVDEDGQVTFQASAQATRVTVVDASQLRSLVKGKTASEAEAALQPYGDAQVTLWPDWVTTVTGVDARLAISVVGQVGSGSGSGSEPPPSGAAGSSPTTANPTASAQPPASPSASSPGSSVP